MVFLNCKSLWIKAFAKLINVNVAGSLMGDPALMISLYPEFPADVMSSLASQGEFIFVVDRSGSMGCKMHHGNDAQMRIESARVRCQISDMTQ